MNASALEKIEDPLRVAAAEKVLPGSGSWAGSWTYSIEDSWIPDPHPIHSFGSLNIRFSSFTLIPPASILVDMLFRKSGDRSATPAI